MPTPTQPPLGQLIIFEGIDGTGKSTQIKKLHAHLEQRGIHVVCSFEPTRGEWGMRVRQAAINNDRLSMEKEVHFLLQDRREHVRDIILPALKRGEWVLLDRYYPSMMAYQGASGANVESIRESNENFAPIPDLVFWLDISLEESQGRVCARGVAMDAFEEESYQSKVSSIYSSMEMPWFKRIDGHGSVEQVHLRILKVLEQELSKELSTIERSLPSSS